MGGMGDGPPPVAVFVEPVQMVPYSPAIKLIGETKAEQRATLAAELLDSGFTVEETAGRLGYSETAAFSRAYSRWNGHPPSRRKQ